MFTIDSMEMGYNHIPNVPSSSQPNTLVVRNRKKSLKIEDIFDQLDDLDGEDEFYLQRAKTKKRDRSIKTLRERKMEQDASQKDSSVRNHKSLGERYAEMKDSDGVTVRNLASLMR